MKSLSDYFYDICNSYNDTAPNNYFNFTKNTIEIIDKFIIENPKLDLSWSTNKLYKGLKEIKKKYTGVDINQFVQNLGELHFWIECFNSGLELERLSERSTATPDFKIRLEKCDKEVFFEVKTFSIVDGEYGINRETENSLNDRIKLEEQINRGKRIASTIRCSNQYGDKLTRDKEFISLIHILIDKFENNFKSNQFNKPTFYVVNFLLNEIPRIHNAILRPYYSLNYRNINMIETGLLWAMAFGTNEMLVLYPTEFEGKPAIQGILQKQGVLIEYKPNVLGIIFMIYSFGDYKGMFGLSDFKENREISENILNKLTGNNWNDNLDSNGWQLQKTRVCD